MRDLMQTVETLMEAVRYEDMLTSLFAELRTILDPDEINSLERKAADIIREAKPILKKNDRMVWFMRLVRIGIAWIAGRANPKVWENGIGDREYKSYYAKSKGSTRRLSASLGYEIQSGRLLETLKHYLSLPVHAIQETVFLWQTPEELLQHFEELENLWKAENSGLIPHDPEDGEVVIHFPDQFEWVLLPRGYCKQEAEAMGHCGNAGAAHGDRILSLRKLVAKSDTIYHQLFLTFILRKDGYLGEMKGRGNDKPAKRYHPYIIALLKLDLIKGIRGGGYKPENNFRVSDLDEKTREELIQAKPELGSAADLYRIRGMSPELGKKIISELEDNGIDAKGWTDDYEFLIIDKFSDWMDAAKSLTNKDSSGYIDYIDGSDFLEVEGPRGREAFEDILDTLRKKHSKDYFEFVEKLTSSYADEIAAWEEEEDETFDSSLTRDVARFVDYLDDSGIDDIANAFHWAGDDGARSGTEKEIVEAFAKWFKDFGDKTSLIYAGHQGESTLIWDTEVLQVIPLPDVIHLLENADEMEDISQYGWDNTNKGEGIRVPYYGFSGYDEDYAAESFLEHMGEINWPEPDDLAA